MWRIFTICPPRFWSEFCSAQAKYTSVSLLKKIITQTPIKPKFGFIYTCSYFKDLKGRWGLPFCLSVSESLLVHWPKAPKFFLAKAPDLMRARRVLGERGPKVSDLLVYQIRAFFRLTWDCSLGDESTTTSPPMRMRTLLAEKYLSERLSGSPI